jgi:hypothetical protein
MEVAGADLGPGVGDADDGLVQVFFAETDAAEVRASRGAGRAFGEDDGVFLRIDFVGHFFLEVKKPTADCADKFGLERNGDQSDEGLIETDEVKS